MAESQFTGKAQDYLDWFSVDYVKNNKIYLPPTSSLMKAPEKAKPVLSTRNKFISDKSYVDKHIKEHIVQYKNNIEVSSAVLSETKPRHEGLDDISTIVDTESVINNDEGQERMNEEAFKTLVYQQFDFTKYSEESLKLPVYNSRNEILQKINNFSVVIVQGATGCGKSTQVPQYILDDAVDKNKHVNIIVTQPRKIAATSLANRVCQERGWDVGRLVAYQIGLDNQATEHTRLTYVTTEVFVQKIINKRSLNEFTHIVLDEVHERDHHTDFALLVVKKLLHTVSRHVKIILMSATIDCEKFSKYFATPFGDQLFTSPVIPVAEHTPHSVHMFYLEDLQDIFPNRMLPSYSLDDPKIGPEMLQTAVNLIHMFDELENLEGQAKQRSLVNYRGAVLVFVPGLRDIETLIETLKQDAKRKRWELYPLHSSITLAEQKASFRPSQVEVRKIIVSTNIAESSITVPDIKYIVDFCLTKVISCDPMTNFTSLKLAWTSKSSCQQRAGRVGRVSSGRVYRLVEMDFYERLESHPTPEICRSPLSSVVLKIKQLDMGAPETLLALALDPPDLSDIYRTVLVLKQIGALTLKYRGVVSSSDGDLTFLGRVAAALPLDPKLSKLIIMGYMFGCIEETIVIAAGISLKSFYSTPFQDELNAFVSKVYWAHESFCDCLALWNTYSCWENLRATGKFDRNKSSEKAWASKGYIQLECLKDVKKLVDELKSRLYKLKLLSPGTDCHYENYSWSEVKTFLLKVCIAGAFFPNYYKKLIPDEYEKNICRDLNANDPFSTLVLSGLPSDTNVLYDEQIRTIFQDCSKGLSINFDGSKAYVKFPKRRRLKDMDDSDKDIPGQFPTAMHLALKMKQIPRTRRNLRLNLISPEIANEQLNSNSSSASSYSTKQMNKCAVAPPVMPHPSVSMIEVRITNVESPSRFWMVADGADYIEKESYIEQTIFTNPLIPLSTIRPNHICLGPYKEDSTSSDFSYFRARIEEINERKNKALIYFIDFGNSEVVDIETLMEMPLSLLSIPMLAIEASLSEIKPSFVINDDKSWSERAVKWTRDNILDGEFFAKIYSVVDNVIHLELFKKSMNQVDGMSVNKMLVKNGLARRADEFYMSKQNHELRAIVRSSTSAVKNNDIHTAAASAMNCTSSSSSVDARSLSLKGSATSQAHLRGPYSPLEMTFSCLTRAGATKRVQFERNSVNSTALDLEPQNYCDRLIVSPYVVLSGSESTVVLHHSTLMPVLPGMLGLCLLTFSPYVELRVSKDGSTYIGALCGLGFDPATGDPIYPEEDVEIAFDFRVTKEHIQRVNFLRYLMSVTLMEFDDQPLYNLSDARASLRNALMQIFEQTRSYSEPVIFFNSHMWNQVPKCDILDSSEDLRCEDSDNFTWKLINEVKLHSVNIEENILEQTKRLRELFLDLTAERRPDSEVVNEECVVCAKKLKTVGDLKFHLKLKSHSIKVGRVFGL